MVRQCHQLHWTNWAILPWEGHGERYLVKCTKQGECEGKIKRLFCGTLLSSQLSSQLSSFSQQCDSQKLTENMGNVRTLRKSTGSYAQAYTFCSLSVCLYLSRSLPHTHICTLSHTHYSVQPKHPWGRASGCWKCQTALSRPISVREPNHCVCRCVYVLQKHPIPRLAALLVWAIS